MHASPDFYATLAQIGEAVLMNALDALDSKDRIVGFEAFVSMIEKEGVPFPFFEENLPIDTVQTVGDEDSPDRNIEHGQTTFARVIAQALTTEPVNETETAQQASWPARIAAAMRDRPLKQNLLDSLLFEFASRGGNPQRATDLVGLGANPDKIRPSRKKNEISTNLTCFGEAVAYGRLETAIALIPFTKPEAALKTVHHIHQGHPPVVGQRQRVPVEAMLMGSKLATPRAASVLEFLDQIDTAYGAETTRGARAGALKGYLHHCHNLGRTWDSNTLELLCTKHPPSSPSSLWKDFHDLFEGDGRPSVMRLNTWVDLARDAVFIGCAPVLEAVAPMIRQQTVDGMCPMLEIASSLRSTPMGDPYVPQQFKAAMSVLVSHGVNLNITSAQDVPLVFHLATSGPHALSKLAILLELGMDPHARQPTNSQPATDLILDPEIKARWESVVRSFEARKTAHSVLDELNTPSP